jgi:hypothetical protein
VANVRQQSVNDSWSCIMGNLWGDRLQIVIDELLAAIICKETVKCSLPHHEYECHQSVNMSWSCILGTLRGDRLHVVITVLLAAHLGKRDSDTLPAPS